MDQEIMDRFFVLLASQKDFIDLVETLDDVRRDADNYVTDALAYEVLEKGVDEFLGAVTETISVYTKIAGSLCDDSQLKS